MKILQVHNQYQQPGGEDQVAAAEALLLEEKGHEVVHYTKHNDAVNDLARMRLAALTVWNRTAYREVRGVIRRSRPEVMHCHNIFPLISPAVYDAARDEGVPVVQTLHNYRLVCPGALLFRDGKVCDICLDRRVPWPGIRHACYRQDRAASTVVVAMLTAHRLRGTWKKRVHTFISLTDFARSKLIAGGLPADKLVVKPNFVTPDPGVGARQGGYALYVGRLSAEKGIRTLLRAWEDMDPTMNLMLVGDGPLRDDVERAAATCPGITWAGLMPRDRTLDLLKDAMMLVFPSEWYEGFPMVLAEAMAAGIPIVCSALGSGGSIVRDGVFGYHFRAGDAADLARVVSDAVASPDRLAVLASSSRKEYESLYSAEENYRQLTKIYADAMA